MKNKFLLVLSILGLFVLQSLVLPVLAEEEGCCKPKQNRTINVSGSATVSSAPDLATISFNIKTEDIEVKKAREENARIAKEVLNAVRGLGIAESNITMLNLNINEENEWDPKLRKSIFKAYVAKRSFKVQVKKSELDEKTNLSDKVAQVVTAIVENGTNQLQNVQYGLVNDDALSNEALAKAIANAKEKAVLMLTPLGAELGKVTSVNESTSRPVPYIKSYARMAMTMDMAESSAMPEPDSFSEGDIEVTSSVNLVFEIL